MVEPCANTGAMPQAAAPGQRLVARANAATRLNPG